MYVQRLNFADLLFLIAAGFSVFTFFFVADTSRTRSSDYIFSLPFFQVRTIAEWQIHDQNDQKVFCFDVPVEIV